MARGETADWTPPVMVASNPTISLRMAAQRRRDTAPELALRRELHRLGLRFRVDRPLVSDRRRRADIVFGPAMVAVLVDGCFWHRCPLHGNIPKSNTAWWLQKLEGNTERDRDTDRVLKADGWAVVRIWEHEEAANAAQRVKNLVVARRGARSSSHPL